MELPAELHGTRWSGTCEVWLDPLGDVASRSEAMVSISRDEVAYTWQHEGTDHQGRIVLLGDDAEFTDTWHQPEPMHCATIPGARGLFQVLGAYGPESEWGWRIALAQRPGPGDLVLQMTNIAPWGEEARAVRMACSPATPAQPDD